MLSWGSWDLDFSKGAFSIKNSSGCFMSKCPKFTWRGLAYDSKASPRAFFIVWLVAHTKLLTMDRLSKWGISVDTSTDYITRHRRSTTICFLNALRLLESEIWCWVGSLMLLHGHGTRKLHIWGRKYKRKIVANLVHGIVWVEFIYEVWIQRCHAIYCASSPCVCLARKNLLFCDATTSMKLFN